MHALRRCSAGASGRERAPGLPLLMCDVCSLRARPPDSLPLRAYGLPDARELCGRVLSALSRLDPKRSPSTAKHYIARAPQNIILQEHILAPLEEPLDMNVRFDGDLTCFLEQEQSSLCSKREQLLSLLSDLAAVPSSRHLISVSCVCLPARPALTLTLPRSPPVCAQYRGFACKQGLVYLPPRPPRARDTPSRRLTDPGAKCGRHSSSCCLYQLP